MATTFDRWEKDPFFAAAEEVQDSADRLESVYRQWALQQKDERKSNSTGTDQCFSDELRRELHTALGTAKWQLEELESAVKSSDEALSAGDDTRARHGEFVSAIGNRISTMEKYLRELNLENGESSVRWVRLDEGERDELEQFLSCPSIEEKEESSIPASADRRVGNNLVGMNGEASIRYSKDSFRSNESSSLHVRDRNMYGCHRSASCAGDIGAYAVTIPSEGEDTSGSSDDRTNLPPPRVLSFSVLSSALDSTSMMGWYKNGFRKWTARNQDDITESITLRNHESSQLGTNASYERNKSCLSRYGNDTYNKRLYGYLGTFRRLLLRSQYQVQYAHRSKFIFWGIVVVLLLVIFIQRARR